MDARITPWIQRAAWASLPVTAAPAFTDALAHQTSGARLAIAVGLWAVWAITLLATLVPHPVSLTALRSVAGAAPCAVLAAAGSARVPAIVLATALAATIIALAVSLHPSIGVWAVNGPAYANERRFPLAVPVALMLGPLELAWAVVTGVPSLAVVLLASRRWLAGAVVVAAGVPAVAIAARALYGLARRWVVFVPAGLVLHDATTLADPVLFRREIIERVGPAVAGTDALDLCAGAPGLALELELHEKVPMVRVAPSRRGTEAGASARLMFTPTRPGSVLAEALARRLPVRASSER